MEVCINGETYKTTDEIWACQSCAGQFDPVCLKLVDVIDCACHDIIWVKKQKE